MYFHSFHFFLFFTSLVGIAVIYILLIGSPGFLSLWLASVQFSCSVMSDSLRSHGLQHTRLPCPSPAPGIGVQETDSCPSMINDAIQSIGVSPSASVLPMNTQYWFPLEWTGWISLQSKGLSRVFSNTTVQKHQFFVLSFLYSPAFTSIHDYWKNHSFDYTDLCWQSNVSAFQYAV